MINQENLIKDNYYTSTSMQNGKFIWKCDENKQYIYSSRLCASGMNYSFSTIIAKHNWKHNIKNSTSEEIHWLNSCIEQNEFITFEKAMETFIPEYVECVSVSTLGSNHYTLNKVYKIINKTTYPKYISIKCDKNFIQNIEDWCERFIKDDNNCFKLSTKEAYDAQFVVKEPEFILPEKWCVKVTDNNLDYFKSLNEYKSFNLGNWSSITGLNSACDTRYVLKRHKKITFEQFKKYVLKEETVEEVKIIEPLPQFKIIESIETITKVENNEGNQFFIGDVVKSLSNVIYNITKFEYNENKTQIIVILNETSRFDINQIEHYIEPKVEVKDEFILPEKWCTKLNSEIINNWLNINKQTDSYYNSVNQYQIVHFPAINGAHLYNNIQNDYTEITFEQFKKYVLKEESIVKYPINTKVLNTQTDSIYIKKEDGWYKTSNKTGYTDEMITKSNHINIVEEVKIIEPLPQFKIIESIETITKVENNEGNQFFIGDVVIGSKNKIKSKIISFKYNVDKTAILAITNKAPNIGIGINHLEHYIESTVKII